MILIKTWNDERLVSPRFQALLSAAWQLFPFPPLQLGLALLLEGRGRQITEADKAAVAHSLFEMLKAIAPKDRGWRETRAV